MTERTLCYMLYCCHADKGATHGVVHIYIGTVVAHLSVAHINNLFFFFCWSRTNTYLHIHYAWHGTVPWQRCIYTKQFVLK